MTAPSKPVMPEPGKWWESFTGTPDDLEYSKEEVQSHHEAWSLYCASLEADYFRIEGEMLREHEDHKQTVLDAAAVLADRERMREALQYLEREGWLSHIETQAISINGIFPHPLGDAIRANVQAVRAALAPLNKEPTTK